MVERIFASNVEIVIMGNLLHAHCLKIDETEYFKFEDEWSDKEIALHTHPRLNENHAKRLRVEMGLKLAPSTKPDPRLVSLQKVIDSLALQLHELTDKHNKLADTLALNKVADVRHLKVAAANEKRA